MAGVQVGKRIIGADAPVIVGWENIGKVQGGPIKQFVFTYFQPAMLFAAILFWYYAPNWLAVASTAIAIRLGWMILLLGYAIFLQLQMGLEPCPLCIFQRIHFIHRMFDGDDRATHANHDQAG